MYPRWTIYIYTLLVFSPRTRWCIYAILPPSRSCAGLQLFPHQHQRFPLFLAPLAHLSPFIFSPATIPIPQAYHAEKFSQGQGEGLCGVSCITQLE